MNSDSDFEYEEYNSKKKKGGKSKGGSKGRGVSYLNPTYI